MGPKSSTRLSFLDRLADAEAKDNERMGGDEVASAALVGGGRDVARKAAAAAEAEAEAEVAAATTKAAAEAEATTAASAEEGGVAHPRAEEGALSSPCPGGGVEQPVPRRGR